jgi:hypothetical protein
MLPARGQTEKGGTMRSAVAVIVLLFTCLAFGQDAQAYTSTGDSIKGGLLDRSRFSIHNSLSFGMGAASGYSLQSQGLYSTMLTYKVSEPITLNLNFGFPLFSSFNATQNLNSQNITSAEYFKNMPLAASLSWKPTDNMFFLLSFERMPGGYYSDFSSPLYYLPVNRGAAAAIAPASGR